MSLKIKNFKEIFKNLVEWTTAKTDKITDFNIGSAIRTLYEAIAIQFEEYYFTLKQGILYAIEHAIYNAFGFELKLSKTATGFVNVSFKEPLPSPIVFPKGTMFCTSATYGYIYFNSTEEVTAPKNSTGVSVPIIAKSTGQGGNIPKGAITTIVTTNVFIKEVNNPEPISNGRNEETSSERKKRFQDYIKTLARGTRDAILYGTLEVEGVAGAWVDDNYIGYVKLYAHDSNGELSEELRINIKKNLDNYRAAGIEVDVLPIVKRPTNLSIELVIDNDYDVEVYKELIKNQLRRFLNEFTVSKDLFLSDIIHSLKLSFEDIIINVNVKNFKDILIGDNELIRAGEITVDCINLKNWRN